MTLCVKTDIWILDLKDPSWSDAGSLAPRELQRAGRYHNVDDARLFEYARTARRLILGKETGIEPALLQFIEGEYGKPMLAAPENNVKVPYFSQSRSRNLSLLAVSWDGETGVDVEWCEPDFPTDEVASWAFNAQEQACLMDSEDPRLFWRIWTRKEALLKAVGFGFHKEPRDCGVCPPIQFGTIHPTEGGFSWFLQDLAIADGYAASVAVAGKQAEIRLRRM